MKITNRTLMLTFETEVKLGINDAIELTLIHQAFICKEDGKCNVDIDLGIDVLNVRFLGIPIEPGYEQYRKFKKSLLELGIDIEKLINEYTNMNMQEIKEQLIQNLSL